MSEDCAGYDEDDVYLISVLVNTLTQSSELVVFDGRNVASGPVSRLPLPVMIPFGLHGCFVPGLTFDAEDLARRFKVRFSCNMLAYHDFVYSALLYLTGLRRPRGEVVGQDGRRVFRSWDSLRHG